MPKKLFQKGNTFGIKGKPKGTFSPFTRFKMALEQLEKKKKINLFYKFMQEASKDNRVLCEFMSKMVPNKAQIGMGPEDIMHILGRVSEILRQEITDPAVLERITKKLEELEIKESM